MQRWSIVNKGYELAIIQFESKMRNMIRKLMFKNKATLTFSLGLPFGFLLYMFGSREPSTIFIFVLAGLFFGITMSIMMTSRYSYFIQNIKEDNYNLTRKYNQLFRNKEIPASPLEREGYIKYLNELEKTYSGYKIYIYIPLAASIMSFFIELSTEGISTTTLLPLFAIIMILIATLIGMRQLTKIKRVKNKLSQAE